MQGRQSAALGATYRDAVRLYAEFEDGFDPFVDRDYRTPRRYILSPSRIYLGLSQAERRFVPEQVARNRDNLLQMISSTAEAARRQGASARSGAVLGRLKTLVEAVRVDATEPEESSKPQEEEDELVIPEQSPAPVQVTAKNNRLEMPETEPPDGALDPTSVSRLRQTARLLLSNAIRDIESSTNVDRRYVGVLKSLRSQIGARDGKFSVEATGSIYRVAADQLHKHRDAMSQVALGQVEESFRVTRTVVEQFSEWRAYRRAQERIDHPEREAGTVVAVAHSIANDLEASGLADEAIYERIRTFTEAAASGLVRADTVVTPLLASISNLLAEAARVVLANPALVDLAKDAVAQLAAQKGLGFFVLFCAHLLRTYGNQLASVPSLRFASRVAQHLERRGHAG